MGEGSEATDHRTSPSLSPSPPHPDPAGSPGRGSGPSPKKLQFDRRSSDGNADEGYKQGMSGWNGEEETGPAVSVPGAVPLSPVHYGLNPTARAQTRQPTGEAALEDDEEQEERRHLEEYMSGIGVGAGAVNSASPRRQSRDYLFAPTPIEGECSETDGGRVGTQPRLHVSPRRGGGDVKFVPGRQSGETLPEAKGQVDDERDTREGKSPSSSR